MPNNKIVKVVVPNIKGKAIVQSGSSVYVIQSLAYYKDQELLVDLDTALYFPSMLYAMATLYEDDFEAAVKFIKESF